MAFPYDAIKSSIDFILHFHIAGNSYQTARAELQRRLLFFTLEDTENKKIISSGPIDRLSRWTVDPPILHGYQQVFENGGVWIKPITDDGLYLPKALWDIMVGGHAIIKREDGNDLVQDASTIAREKGKPIGAYVSNAEFSCTFENCNFSNNTFDGCLFDSCELHNVDFNRTKFINCYFSNVSLMGSQTNMTNTVWEGCTVDADTIELTENIPHTGAKGTGPWLFEPNKLISETWKF